jgi:large subunit ribosomal protein L25
MASSYYKLDISSRHQTGSKESKIARKKGLIPGILYYSGEEALSISIEKSILLRAMNSGQRIFEINQDGESQYTMLKQVQYHPVTDEVMHIDLMRVRRSEKMTISVPIVLVGDAIGVKEGGVLSQSLTQVEISCYPTDVPEQIDLKIDDLEINAALSVGDIDTGSEDIELISDASLNIVSITTPVSEEVVDEEVEEDEDSDGKDSSDEKADESSEERSDDKTEN